MFKNACHVTSFVNSFQDNESVYGKFLKKANTLACVLEDSVK